MIKDPGDDNHLTWLGCPDCVVATKSNFLTPELIATRTFKLCNSDCKDAKKDVDDAQGLQIQIIVNKILTGIVLNHVLKPHNDLTTVLSKVIPFDIFNDIWNGAIGILLPKMLETMSVCKSPFKHADSTNSMANVFCAMTEAQKTAIKNKAPFHTGKVVVNTLLLLRLITREHGPK